MHSLYTEVAAAMSAAGIRQYTAESVAAYKAAKAAREAAAEAERLGEGHYVCPMCGHHQDTDGECEYCGDSKVSAVEEPAAEEPAAVVVTRHSALLQYLAQSGVIPAGTPVVAHATEEDVQGKHVYGVLPMRLAAEAAALTEVSMTVPAEWRGAELSLDQIKACNPRLTTYVVKRVR